MSDLTGWDWVAMVVFFIVVIAVTTAFRKWAFSYDRYPETSIRWHIPRFLFVAITIALVTMPLIGWAFGYVGVRIYGQFVFPELAIVVYLVWALVSERTSVSGRSDAEESKSVRASRKNE